MTLLRTRPIRLGLALIAVSVVGLLAIAGATAQRAPLMTAEASAEIEAQLAAEGQVGVIVGVDAPFAPQVGVDDAKAQDQQQAVIDAARAALIASLDLTGTVTVESNSTAWVIPFVALNVDAAAYAALLASPLVTSIEYNRAYPVDLASTIPIVEADDLWALGFQGTGQTVAVLDTGTAATHSSLTGRVVAEACYSGASGSTTLCPNLTTTQTGAGASHPSRCLTLFGGATDCSHGTHVSSTVAGNDATIQGVARGANVIGVQVFSQLSGESRPLSYSSDQVSGLNFVYGLRNTYSITSVNMSLGGGLYTSTCDSLSPSTTAIFSTLRTAGIMPVIAAGNDGSTVSISFPACISTAVSVGSTDDNDARSSFSNSLPSMLDLFAPGSNVTAAFATGYGTMSGTSMATPHVAGAFALLKSAVPSATTEQILTAMQGSGVPITVPGGSTRRIKLGAAYTLLTGGTLPTPSPTRTPPLPPANDLSSGAVVISALPYTVTQNDVASAGITGDPIGWCLAGSNIVWYRFTQPSGSTQTVTVSTLGSNYDTVVGVFTDPAVNVTVVCNDDSDGTTQSRASFSAASGVTYYIGIGKYGSDALVSGASLSLSVTGSGSGSSNTATPSNTPTPSNTLAATNTPTPTPTRTASPTFSPTPTAVPIVYVYMTLQGRPAAPHASWAIPVSVRMTRLSDNVVVHDARHTTDNYGTLAINMPLLVPGSYRVRVKHSHTLASSVDVTMSAGGSQFVNVPVLREGDMNGDNVVNITDFSILAASFGQTGAP